MSTDRSVAESAFWHGQSHMPSVRGNELVIVKGEGSYVWTEEGDRLFDATASLWYCNIGHGRGEVVDAVRAQMRELEAYHTFANFSNRPAEELTRRLRQMAPIEDARIFLTSGGSDSSMQQQSWRAATGYTRAYPASTSSSHAATPTTACMPSGPVFPGWNPCGTATEANLSPIRPW